MDLEIVGLIAGTLSCITFVPQIIKTYQSKSVNDVSITTFVIIAISNLLWLYYGVEMNSPSIILTNVVVFASATAMISMKLLFTTKDSPRNKE